MRFTSLTIFHLELKCQGKRLFKMILHKNHENIHKIPKLKLITEVRTRDVWVYVSKGYTTFG